MYLCIERESTKYVERERERGSLGRLGQYGDTQSHHLVVLLTCLFIFITEPLLLLIIYIYIEGCSEIGSMLTRL